MTVERVLIQKKRGEFASVNGYVAWAGFDRLSFETAFFEWPDMERGAVPVSRDTLVVGGVGTVRHALGLLGVSLPNLDYPERLRPYLGRAIDAATLRDVRARFCADDPEPLFAKPRDRHKAFDGYLLRAFRDLIATAHLPDDMAVWTSPVIELASEWRVFVHGGAILGVGHYRGDPFTPPAGDTVRAALADFAPDAPAAYAADFGITPDGRTLLIEVNDGYSLGSKGLSPVLYARMLQARWLELTALG